VKLVEFIK